MSDQDPVSVAVQQIRHVDPGVTPDMIQYKLDGDQHSVLTGLLQNKNMTDAAKAANIPRSVVYRWLKCDPYFVAAVNAVKGEQREASMSRLSQLTDTAVESVEKALSGDPKLAYKFLKDTGCLKKKKHGPIDPALVRQQLTADLKSDSTLPTSQALTQLLAQAGLSTEQQRGLLIETLRSHRKVRVLRGPAD